MTIKHLFIAAVAAVTLAGTAQAQVKIGSNPASITASSVLDVEGTSGNHTVVMQNGNMGVGTVSPLGRLHSASDLTTYPGDGSAPVDGETAQVMATSADGAKKLLMGVNTTTAKGYIQSIHSGIAWTDLLLQPYAGNLGIGNFAPSNKLHVTSGANPLRLEGVQAGASTDELLSIDATGVVRKVAQGGGGGTIAPYKFKQLTPGTGSPLSDMQTIDYSYNITSADNGYVLNMMGFNNTATNNRRFILPDPAANLGMVVTCIMGASYYGTSTSSLGFSGSYLPVLTTKLSGSGAAFAFGLDTISQMLSKQRVTVQATAMTYNGTTLYGWLITSKDF